MNTSTTLYFPETIISRRDLCPLLCFFEKISYYQPAESDPAPAPDIFAEKELCQGYIPAPLGEAMTQFQQMIKDLAGHEDEYYGGYLSSLSAGLQHDMDEASVRGLIDQLHQTGQETKNLDQEKERDEKKLWQARLFLKLAEIVQKNQAEIRQGLLSAAQRKNQLLHDLKGEEFAGSKELEALASWPAISAPGPKIDPAQLISSWGQLFLRDTAIPQFLATSNQEAAEIIFDLYEKNFQAKPLELLSISLPAFTEPEIADDNICLEKINTLQGELTANRQQIIAILTDLATTGPDENKQQKLRAEEAAWDKKLAEQKGETRLYFHLLPGATMNELMKRLTKSAGETKKASGDTQHTIIAVLS